MHFTHAIHVITIYYSILTVYYATFNTREPLLSGRKKACHPMQIAKPVVDKQSFPKADGGCAIDGVIAHTSV